MSFYTYYQNNSGGSFHIDHAAGLSEYVIVEANDAGHADYVAGTLGIYFDGVEQGYDCDCCGDRWFSAEYSMDAGTEVPMVYGQEAHRYKGVSWSKGPSGYVHYADGKVVAFGDN